MNTFDRLQQPIEQTDNQEAINTNHENTSLGWGFNKHKGKGKTQEYASYLGNPGIHINRKECHIRNNEEPRYCDQELAIKTCNGYKNSKGAPNLGAKGPFQRGRVGDKDIIIGEWVATMA
jgi:hypothetical protein